MYFLLLFNKKVDDDKLNGTHMAMDLDQTYHYNQNKLWITSSWHGMGRWTLFVYVSCDPHHAIMPNHGKMQSNGTHKVSHDWIMKKWHYLMSKNILSLSNWMMLPNSIVCMKMLHMFNVYYKNWRVNLNCVMKS